MLKRFIYYMFERRHYWRHVSFSEVAELYASRTMRIIALSMVVVFVGIYLYKNGYSLSFIMLYFSAYFVLRAALAVPFSFLIARFGPKHMILASNLLYVPSLISLALLQEFGIWALVGTAVFQALSVTLYDIAYLVDFSKVKHDDHAGKEIGYMHILEHVAKAISPVVGGFIAYWVSPEATLVFAATVFALSAIPLFFTPEPVRTHQKITYYGLPWRKISRTVVSQAAVGVDIIASGLLWSMFVAIAVFGTATDVVYAQIGVLSSISVIAGVVAARIFGAVVDRRRGNELLTTGVVAKALTHLGRAAVATPFGAVMINVFNEITSTAYLLPYTKGMFSQADDLPGYRIVYMTLMSVSAALGAALLCASVALLAGMLDETVSLQAGFVLSAILTLAILAHGFRRYLKPRFFFQ